MSWSFPHWSCIFCCGVTKRKSYSFDGDWACTPPEFCQNVVSSCNLYFSFQDMLFLIHSSVLGYFKVYWMRDVFESFRTIICVATSWLFRWNGTHLLLAHRRKANSWIISSKLRICHPRSRVHDSNHASEHAKTFGIIGYRLVILINVEHHWDKTLTLVCELDILC